MSLNIPSIPLHFYAAVLCTIIIPYTVTRSGTVGVTVLCGNSYTSFAASDHCFRLRLGEEMRGYVTTYLQSKIGNALLTRNAHGKVIKELKEDDILHFRIPIIPSEQRRIINDLAIQSSLLIDKARAALDKADTSLSKALGECVNNNQYRLLPKTSSIYSSNSLLGSRLDPHFYEPNVICLRNYLKAMPNLSLGRIADVWAPGRFKRHRTNIGYGVPLYSSADIMRAQITPSTYISATRNKRNIDRCQIEKGMILIPCSGTMGGILGRAMYTSRTLDGCIVTQHIMRVSVKHRDFQPEYVAAFLGNMLYGYPLITSYRYGKDVPELEASEIKTIPIPFLSPTEQEAIADHVREAYDALDQSNLAANQAQNQLLAALKWDDTV